MKRLFIAGLSLAVLITAAAFIVACTNDSGSQPGSTSGTITEDPVTTPDVIDTEGPKMTEEPKITEEPGSQVTERPPVTGSDAVTESETETVTTEPEVTETEEDPKPVINAPVFKADLSDYEKYMNPSDEDWSDAYLVLLNAAHPMEKDFENKKDYAYLNSRVKVGSTGMFTYLPGAYFNVAAFNAFTAMALEAHEYGIDNIDITSAYRSYSKQDSVFNSNVSKTNKYVCNSCDHVCITKASYKKCESCGGAVTKVDITYEEAAAQVATYSCAPGTSDHQSGLAVDIVQTSLPSKYNSLIEEFGDTECGKWLAEHCWDFGFVLRFPADKEDITGIIYEPWHFRFVGRYHALMMRELNMCLEEYIVYLEETGYFEEGVGVTGDMTLGITPVYPGDVLP